MSDRVLDERVMVRAELVRRKQDREALQQQEQELDLDTARSIRKARECGVPMEEATSLAGIGSRPMGYRLIERLELHEAAERAKQEGAKVA